MDVKIPNYVLLFLALLGIILAIAILGPNTPKANPRAITNQSISTSSYPKAPELVGISSYINTNNKSISISQYHGKVILIDFWTYTCINCIRTLPYLEAWYAKYNHAGLIIIGVHSPEFDFEKDYKNVYSAVQKFGIKYPVVQDNDHQTWDAFNNQYWPHIYLIDKDGYIRYDHIGEGDDEQTEQQIQTLLSELNQSINTSLVSQNITYSSDLYRIATPEIYLGYQMARQPLGNPEGFVPDQDVQYNIPNSTMSNYIYFNGTWKNNPDNMELDADTGQILINYDSRSVNIVAGGSSNITITLDGSPDPQAAGMDMVFVNDKVVGNTDALRLYNLVNDTNYRQRTLILNVQGKGFKIYTFTFG